MALHESGEDYLEAILVLRQEHGSSVPSMWHQHLGFSKPSVSRAVSIPKGQRLPHHGEGRPSGADPKGRAKCPAGSMSATSCSPTG